MISNTRCALWLNNGRRALWSHNARRPLWSYYARQTLSGFNIEKLRHYFLIMSVKGSKGSNELYFTLSEYIIDSVQELE